MRNTLKPVTALLNEKAVYSAYLLIGKKLQSKYKPFKLNAVEKITLTLFKLRYTLTDRAIEALFSVDHVTASRVETRVCSLLSKIALKEALSSTYLIVDSTMIPIGRGKVNAGYTGYKKKSAIKIQVICDEDFNIRDVSDGHSASAHDYKIFKREFKRIKSKLDRPVLGDKAYIGLSDKGVLCPVKSNALNKEIETDFNAHLSKRRVKIEHLFAKIKRVKSLYCGFWYRRSKLTTLFKAIALYSSLEVLKN